MEKAFIKSKRNTDIPVSITSNGSRGGLLMLIHGFKSDRFENGRFDEVMNRLLDANYHCIAMDFPGCNDSKEDFLNYSISNCLDDMESCYEYMLNNYDIDTNNLSLLGYSLGGRLIAIFSNKHPEFKNLVFWAGACHNGFEDNKFIEQDITALKKEADELGYCNFYDIYEKCYNKISKQFIDDMYEYKPEDCLKQFKGNALIIQGDKDTTINPNNGQLIYDSLIKANDRVLQILEDADHGFGLYDGRIMDSEKIINLSEKYIKSKL